jgi:long-chain acyl-CoA synthetase
MSHNLATLHRETCRRLGPDSALRFKRFGRYEDLTWNEYRRSADGVAAGLIDLGVQPGERVAIFSENRYEWLIADHAILSAGAVNVPLHAPLTAQQAAYQLAHSEARGVFVSTQQQADKISAVRDRLPQLEFLVSFEPVAPLAVHRQLTFAGLMHRGWRQGTRVSDEILRRESGLTESDLVTLIYTSGTTGNPKGVMLTHGNLLSNATSTFAVCGAQPGDVQLNWLPFSHIYARTVDHYLTTIGGFTMALAESVDTLVDNLKEIRPMWMNSVPRFYEKVWSAVESRDLQSRAAELRRIFGPRIRNLSSGGAPLPRHLAEGFQAAGIALLQGYGLTESSPVISFNSLASNRLGSVGRPIPGVEVTIAADGEILTRGPHVMRGYWKDPEATARTIVDGWLQTGDVGHVDADGFLFITDRKKDLIVTAGGKNIAPTELERLLVSNPWIDQAVVYGDGRPFVVAIVVPNFDKLAEHCTRQGWTLEQKDNFIGTPAVVEFYEQRIDQLMEAVSQPERVKKCLLLARPFQVAGDELTATLKLRRRHILAKFEPQLAALYM